MSVQQVAAPYRRLRNPLIAAIVVVFALGVLAGVGLPRVIGGSSLGSAPAAPAAALAARPAFAGVAANNMSDAVRLATLARTVPGVAANNMSDAVRLATLAPSVLASAPRYGNLHVVKECTAYTGAVGGYCTITSSNLKAIKVGSKIVYGQAAGETALNSDIVLTSGTGNTAVGHCYLGFADGLGLCTISGGTGAFSGFEASVTVTASSTVTKGWNWDGTYSFDKAN